MTRALARRPQPRPLTPPERLEPDEARFAGIPGWRGIVPKLTLDTLPNEAAERERAMQRRVERIAAEAEDWRKRKWWQI